MGEMHQRVRDGPYDGPVRATNHTHIFRPYPSPNPFRGVQIRPYPNPDIQRPIPYLSNCIFIMMSKSIRILSHVANTILIQIRT